jgi:hypothetical protein
LSRPKAIGATVKTVRSNKNACRAGSPARPVSRSIVEEPGVLVFTIFPII